MKPSEFDALANLFAKSSNGFKRANPQLVALDKDRELKIRLDQIKKGLRPQMNKTEAAFSLLLDVKLLNKEITRWIYEGITLRWADMKYTPDFVVFPSFPGALPMMIEVKGGHVYSRDIVRFKGCRAAWPEFGFQLWQYKNKEWKKKL